MLKYFKPSSLFFLSLLLSGCVVTPDLGKLTPLKDIPSYQTQKSFASPLKGWPSPCWWEAYQDPQLSACIEEALRQSPTLAQAHARFEQAAGYAEQIGARLLPSTSLNASLNKLKQSYYNGIPKAFVPKGFKDRATATLDFSYELDFWGRNHHFVAEAISLQEAAALDIAQAQLMIAVALAQSYAELARLYQHYDAAKEALAVRRKTANLFKMRYEKGLENEGSFEQTVAAQEIAEADLCAVEESIELMKNQIAALMGAGPDRGRQLRRPDISIQAFGLPGNIPSVLLTRRPDLAAARARAEAALSKVGRAETEFYPSINLEGFVGHQSLGLHDFFHSGARIASFGPSINLPIFNRRNIRGAYQQARGEYDKAVALYEDTLVHALKEVANVVTKYKKLALRLKKIESATQASQRAYDVINARYKAGVINYLEVLRTEDTLIINRRALADIRSQAFVLDIQLIQALGGGFVMKNRERFL